MRKFTLLLGCCMLFLSAAIAQTKTVTGKVTDANGTPVVNASVVLKGTQVGTTSKQDGTFSLTVPQNAKSLVISAVGLAETTVEIGSSNTISVELKSANKNLEEVVVVGYGTQKRSTLTSSQTKVGGEKLENVPMASVDQILQGKVAGLQSVTSSGQPGAAQSIRIRGIGSLSASADPLFVVDGVQINSGDMSRTNTTANALAGINPDDIDRIDVLKDAVATSIYGSRGANGVILITTKKGKAGKTRIQFSTELGSNTFTNGSSNMRPLKAKDWLMLAKEGLENAGTAPATVTTLLHTYGDTSNIDTDWFGLMTRKGKQQQFNLNASGGTENTTYFASLGYFNQEASLIASNLKRYSGKIGVRQKIGKNLLMDFSMIGSYQYQNSPLSGSSFSNPVTGIYFLRPTQNPFNADGSLNISRVGALNFQTGITHNPLYTLSRNIYNTRTTQAKPNLLVEYNILRGLKFSTRIGADYNNIEEFKYYNPNNGDGFATTGLGNAFYTRYFLYDWINQFDYHVDLLKDKDLSLDAKVGYEVIGNNIFTINAAATNYVNDKLPDLANASVYTSASSTRSDYRFNSAFSNLVLGYKNRYSVSGSFRRDGSSRFGSSQKFGNYYAFGASWNISEEKFFENVKFVSLLKLRASTGLAGNAEIGNYTWIPSQVSGYNYNGTAGTAYETIGNINLGWERTRQNDIGLDVGFFNDRLNLVVDYYDRRSKDLLYTMPLSATTGFTSQTGNVGIVSNKGFEVTINASPIVTKDFHWDLSFNISHNKNKLISMPNGNADVISGLFLLRTGQDYRQYYMRQWAGVDPANGNPLWYLDSTKNATTSNYDAAARFPLNKSASPKYFGGFSNTLTYKGFGITVDFNYNFGNYVYDTWGSYFTDGIYALTYGRYSTNLDRWTTPGQVTNVPKYVYNSANKSNSSSTRYLYKGDFIRLRNLEVFYNASKNVLSRTHIGSLKVYLRGSNLWTKTFDSNLPFDPEQGVNSSSNLSIFLTKSLTAGVTIGL